MQNLCEIHNKSVNIANIYMPLQVELSLSDVSIKVSIKGGLESLMSRSDNQKQLRLVN